MTQLTVSIQEDLLTLLEKLEGLHEFSPFEEKRFFFLLDSLEKEDVPMAHSLAGLYYAQMGQCDKSIEEHEKSLEHTAYRSELLNNYGLSLLLMGRYKKALEFFLRAWELDKTDVGILLGAIDSANLAGDIKMQKMLLRVFQKITGKQHTLELEDSFVFSMNITGEESYKIACSSEGLKDWEHEEEEEAWKHLQ